MMKKAKGTKSKIDVGQELRNLGALIEDNNHKLGGVAEQYTGLQKDVSGIKKTLESHTEMIGKLTENVETVKGDIEIIKDDIEIIKGGLRKKVDYDEFVTLEKRVSRMESKVGR